MKSINVSRCLLPLLLLSCKTKPTEKTKDTRLNILWISAEDLSPRLACYGDTLAKTSTLDWLAENGITFTNAYVTAPVSAPSRACIITGMYATSIGGHNMRTISKSSVIAKDKSKKYIDYLSLPLYEAVPDTMVRCFTEYLRLAGYYCTNNSKTDYNFYPPVTAWDECSNTAHWRNRPKGKPFFAVFNFMDTHESQIWSRKDNPLRIDPTKVTVPPYYPNTEKVRRDIARQYDNLMTMDEKIAILIDQLQEDSLLDNTVIFFFSDHGDGFPRAKRVLYESGIRVPLIVALPGKEDDNVKDDRLVSFVDLAPTVLSLAGVPIPSYMQGIAFLGPQRGKDRQYIYAAADRMDCAVDAQRAVKDKQYKYIVNYMPQVPYVQDIPYRNQMDLMQELYKMATSGKGTKEQMLWFRKTKPAEELYDVYADPYELKNLATDPAYADILSRMRSAFTDWQKNTNDLGLMKERNLIQYLWKSNIQPKTKNPEITFAHRGKKQILVTINNHTPGASVGYKMASESGEWKIYTKPFLLDNAANDTLWVVAHRIGFKASDTIKHHIGRR